MLLVALTLNPIGILIWLILLCLCLWVVKTLLATFQIDNPIAGLIWVVIVVVFVLYLVQLLGGGGGPGIRIT